MSDIPSTSNIERAESTSSATTRKSVKDLFNLELIGSISHQITGAKLPSNRQVLSMLFYNIRFVDRNKKKDAKNSAKLVIDAAKIFWQQARIPICEDHRCVEKLMGLYNVWKNIRKTIPAKRSDAQKKFAEIFSESLDDLFDIAAPNALNEMKITEDKLFLEMQRQKGRPGSMAGVDMRLYHQEKRSMERKEKEETRKRKEKERMEQDNGNATFYIVFC